MRIGLVPPLWTRIPPRTYGGIELVVHLLAEELVRRGHEVTLFGTGDSETSARLEVVVEESLLGAMEAGGATVYEAYANGAVAKVLGRAGDFDVLHFHLGMAWAPFASLVRTPCLFTVHTFASYDDRWLARNFPGVALSGISRYQADQVTEGLGRELPVVYNGVEFGRFEPRYERGEYLAFLGRMSFDKNPLDAIRIAKRAGMRIVVAGQPQQRKEEVYFETEIKPLIDGEQVRYVGPVNHEQKNELLRNAAALIFPVQWEEQFGLVMIEAMACGTPVLAHNLGSVGEVVTPGVTGFYAGEIEGMQDLLRGTLELDRRRVRGEADGRFSAGRMVEGYLEIYRGMANCGTGR